MKTDMKGKQVGFYNHQLFQLNRHFAMSFLNIFFKLRVCESRFESCSAPFVPSPLIVMFQKTVDCFKSALFLSFTELMFLICWMLHPEPRLRATVNDITNCKWLNQYVDVDAYDYDSIFGE